MWRWLEKFKRSGKVGKSKVDKILVRTGTGSAQWTDKDYKKYADETYLKNVIAFRCIKEIAENAASVPWGLFTIDSKGDRGKRVHDHPLMDVIRRPNPKEGFPFLIAKATAFLLMAGNSYMERISPSTGPNKGIPRELYVQRPDRMTIEVNDKTGQISKYIYTVGGESVDWGVDPITMQSDILHLKAFHPTDDWYGAAITESVAREIDTSNEQTEWNKKLLENEGRPGMIVTIVGNLSDEEFERMEVALTEKYGGASKAGKNLILEGERGTKAEPYGWSPTDMDFIEGGRELARRISWGYGVPPQLIGIPGDSTYCLPANTRIAAERGSINIIDVQIGDKVWSINEKNELELKSVIRSGKTGRKQLIKIRTKNRTLIASGNHPVLIRKEKKEEGRLSYWFEYIPMKDVECGDIVVSLENLPEIFDGVPGFKKEAIDYCRYSRVMEITYMSEEDVYDIEVEGNHNFFAEGICVHNSNYQEARLAFYEDTIFYILAYLLSEANNWVFPKRSRLMFDYIIDDIPALAPRRERLWKRAQESNFLTINEKRELVRKDPIPGGDVVLVPSHMITLNDVINPPDNDDDDDEGEEDDLEDDEKERLAKRLVLKKGA